MIFTQLILAHIIGDFILQPGKWVVRKEEKKTASKELYWHVFIHTALSFILLWNLELWWMAVIIGISHFIIDAIKLHLQTNKTRKAAFFLDQGAHLLVILMISFSIGEIDFNFLHDPEFLKTLTVMVFLTFPASVIIKILLSSWIPETQEINKVQTESLVNAGKYIGILERLLVFTFIVTEHWSWIYDCGEIRFQVQRPSRSPTEKADRIRTGRNIAEFWNCRGRRNYSEIII